MTGTCGTASADALIDSLIAVTDCRAAALGQDGWHALAGSALYAAAMTGLLTIAVAWQGYRLLSGGRIAPAEGLSLILRFGFVIALGTSWQAYDHLIYRVATDGPAELSGVIFPSAGVDTTSLSQRLQNAYDTILTPPASAAPAQGAAEPSSSGIVSPESDAGRSDGRAMASSTASADVLVVADAGSWIAARLVTALLLAIGPLASAALLFESTTGLFVGWLRATIGAALASLAIPLAVSLELDMIEGPVHAAALAGTVDIPGLSAIVWSYVLVLAALVFAVQRMAGGVRLPRWRWPLPPATAGRTEAALPGERDRRAAAPTAPPFATASPSRALAIARAVEQRSRHVEASRSNSPIASARIVHSHEVAAPSGSRRASLLADGAHRAGRRRIAAGQRLDSPA